MSFFKVTNTDGVNPFMIDDLGYELGAGVTETISDQFSVSDMYLSADLEAAIIAGDLTVQIDYGTGFQAVAAGDYTNRDCLGAFLNVYEITNENNNEDLVDGSDVNASGPSGNPLHIHDARYFTETELGATTTPTGGSLIGVDDTAWTSIPVPGMVFDDVQEFIDDLAAAWQNIDLDQVYDNDADGVMNVDGTTKPLDLRSDNSNDIIISRIAGVDYQEALLFDVSGDELILGHAAQGALAQIDVRVATDLYVDGNITFTGTITDTTVNNMNVTNEKITLRDGAGTGGDAQIAVERGTTGADASLLWDETADRWKAGLDGSENTIALLELDEIVTGVWEFQGGGTTEPNLYLTDKTSAPSTNLGSASQIPVSMINNELAVYDKTRTKWLGVARMHQYFAGRDNPNSTNEYAKTVGAFTSNQTGIRLHKDMTLVGMSIQTNGVETWTARVRKNGGAANLASLASGGAAGAHATNTDVDFSAGDVIQVYIDGTHINRPFIMLEFAPKY